MALLVVGAGLSVAIIGVLAAIGWVVAVAESAPNIKDLNPRSAHALSQVFASDGTSLGYIHSDSISNPISGVRIPTALKQATIAIEDRRFWQHGALDYQGILRAGVRDVFGGSTSQQGASTLTMQLVDNMYLPSGIRAQHNLKYKIIQAKLAEQLEGQRGKHWILEHYLNEVPYGTVNGQTALGVGAAAEMFFNKPVTQLDLAQEALLAGLPQAPSEYNPFLSPSLALKRRHDVLSAMVKSRYITPVQAAAADREPLLARTNSTWGTRREPYVFDYVVKQLEAKYGVKTVDNGGLKVYTTINLNAQQEARNSLDAYEGGSGNPAAALATVDPSNGHIVAMASTASYDQTKYDYPVQAQRQPGSAFKVFALMTLIHDYNGDPNQTYYTSRPLPAGWLPSDPTWSVHTAEKTYQGTINLTKATIVSDNTVYAQLAADIGMSKLDAMARAMGITSPLNGNPAEVIGGLRVGVTPLEMADAYATLANGGNHIAPTILNKVVFPDGSVDHPGDPHPHRVFSPGQAAAATNVLKQVITNSGGTGTAANFGCPAAGKTGTAENMDNAWFVGYTPKLSTAVWVGYPQGNIPMANGFGGSLAAPIWHSFMSSASNGYCGDFPQSGGFAGTAFSGPHSASGSAAASSGNSGSQSYNGNGGGGNNGGGYNGGSGGNYNGGSGGNNGGGYNGGSGGTSTSTSTGNSYYNQPIYAQPTQPAPQPLPPTPAPPSGGGGGAAAGSGNGGGGGKRG